jgi:hypothetical protein
MAFHHGLLIFAVRYHPAPLGYNNAPLISKVARLPEQRHVGCDDIDPDSNELTVKVGLGPYRRHSVTQVAIGGHLV